MLVWIIGGVVVVGVVVAAVRFADQYGQGKRGVPGRHEDTGEFPTVKVETDEGYGDFRTVAIPKTIVVGPETPKTPVLEDRVTAIHPSFRPPLPVRTDTVMMEAVDPTKYPDWAKEKLENNK